MRAEDIKGHHYPNARPLTEQSVEAANPFVVVIAASAGHFVVDGEEHRVFVAGPRAAPLSIEYSPGVDCTEWRLSPLRSLDVLNVSARDIADRVVELDDLPKSANRDRLRNGGAFLPLSSDPSDGTAAGMIAGAGWRRLAADPCLGIGSLAAALDVSVRRLEQAFDSEIGLSPKTVQRLMRFDHVRRAMSDADVSLADLAFQFGYSDQSHMSREVKAVSGMSPAILRDALSKPQ